MCKCAQSLHPNLDKSGSDRLAWIPTRIPRSRLRLSRSACMRMMPMRSSMMGSVEAECVNVHNLCTPTWTKVTAVAWRSYEIVGMLLSTGTAQTRLDYCTFREHFLLLLCMYTFSFITTVILAH